MKTKLRLVLTALAIAGLSASAAVAAPPTGKGKPPTKGPGCKPMVTVVLKGTLATTPGPSATSIMVNVTHGNHFARAYLPPATQPVSIAVNISTKIRRQGKKTLGDLLAGDRVLVQARACKADLAANVPPPLTAVRVVAHPAKA